MGWIPKAAYLVGFVKNEDGTFSRCADKITDYCAGWLATGSATSSDVEFYFASTHPESYKWCGGGQSKSPRLVLEDQFAVNYYPVHGVKYKVYTAEDSENNEGDNSLAAKEYVDSLV